MKICIDCRPIGSQGTGISAFAGSALRALVGTGGRDELVAVATRVAIEGVRLPPRCSVVAVDGTGPLWGDLALPTLLEEHEVDVYFSPLFTCPVVRTARYVVTLHDVFPETQPELCPRSFLEFWGRRVGPSLRSACHAVAVSDWSKQQAVERLGVRPERVSVVHQSVGGRFRPMGASEVESALGRRGLRPGGYVLYVGAVDPRKNLVRLVKAFASLDGQELALAVAGPASVPDHDPVATVSGKKLGSRVRRLGYVPDGELPTLYAGARCFAFPSLAEGFGRPCIEAMASGVPVVASDRTALPETCADAALLPDAGDVGAIAAALATACFDDGRRAELIEAGLRRAREFSDERFASDLLGTFRRAMLGSKEGLWLASR